MPYPDLVRRIQSGEFDLPIDGSPASLVETQIEQLQQYIAALERAKAQMAPTGIDPVAEIERQVRFRQAVEEMFQTASRLPRGKRDLLWNRAWVLGLQTGGLEHVLMLYTILLPLCLEAKG